VIVDIQKNVMAELNHITEDECSKCFQSLCECCNKCICPSGTILREMINNHITLCIVIFIIFQFHYFLVALFILENKFFTFSFMF
jgi:hypothetical protein